ncbi:MAG: amidohydrolase family protein [Thermoleophilia bacterium]
MSDYGVIDIVVNPWTPLEVANEQVGVDEFFYDKVRVPRDKRGGVEMSAYVEKMDRAGIQRSLLIGVRCGDMRMKHSFAIPYERIVSYIEQAPDRFSGLAGIDPSRTMRGLKELETGVRDYGFVGAHLYPHWFEWPPDHAKFYPFYAKCCELGIPIMMQIGHCLDYQRDRILPSVGRPITLDRVAIDFPELTIIGIHLGWPWTEEMIAVAYKHNNVYMAPDAYGPKHWGDSFIHFANTWGQDKCLFGTDWPVVDPERAMREVHEIDFRPEAKRKFLRDNALRLFNLPESKELASS